MPSHKKKGGDDADNNKGWRISLGDGAYEVMVAELTGNEVDLDQLRRMTGVRQKDYNEFNRALKTFQEATDKRGPGRELIDVADNNEGWGISLLDSAYEVMIADLTGNEVDLDQLRRMTGEQRVEAGYAAAPPPEPVPNIDPPKGKRKREEFFPEKEEKKEQKMVVWLAALGAAAAAMFYF